MAEHRSRVPAFEMAPASSDNIGHVRPETKPLVNQELAEANPKRTQVMPLPGVSSPNSVHAGPEA